MRWNGEVDIVLPVTDQQGRQLCVVVEAKARLSRRDVQAWAQRIALGRMAEATRRGRIPGALPGIYVRDARGCRCTRCHRRSRHRVAEERGGSHRPGRRNGLAKKHKLRQQSFSECAAWPPARALPFLLASCPVGVFLAGARSAPRRQNGYGNVDWPRATPTQRRPFSSAPD